MKKVIAPKGYTFRVIKDCYSGFSVQLHKKSGKNKGEVGHVNLVREYSRCYTTHSYLNPSYRNKGFGALMYAKAIQWGMEHGYRVRSSGGSSEDAQRVWRGSTIKRWFDIKVKKGFNYGTEVHNPGYDTFYPRLKKEERARKLAQKRRAARR